MFKFEANKPDTPMERVFPAGRSNLLLLQHKPALAPVLIQALSPMNCEVLVANDPKHFHHQFSESLVNPFRIFGSPSIHGIILDLVFATRKSLETLRELRERFSNIPPVAGICRPEMEKQASLFQEDGIAALIAFPGKGQSLQKQLGDFLKKYNKTNGSPGSESVSYHLDNLPVVNLKTYGMFRDLAGLQEFPLDPLFESFLEEMQGFLFRLISEFERENYSACERFVVSVRSLGGTLGASQMAQTARYLEFYLKTGQNTEAGQLIPYLIEQFMTLRDYLKKDSMEEARISVLK